MASQTPDPRSKGDVLRHAQQALNFLDAQKRTMTASIESAELWNNYEQLMVSCLKAGDDRSAHVCLERLVERFGSTNEHVMGLRGLYQEAVAPDSRGLEQILEEYEGVLSVDPANFNVMKRHASLLRSLSRPVDAINAIVKLLAISPTDVEAWAELSDVYLSMSMFAQAVYCLEEVILIVPNAWNIHARLGEILVMASSLDGQKNKAEATVHLSEAIRRFCRSIELCEDYLRGYYGLKLATDRLLNVLEDGGATAMQSSQLNLDTVRRLNTRANAQIKDILSRNPSCYEAGHVIAARELLQQSTTAD